MRLLSFCAICCFLVTTVALCASNATSSTIKKSKKNHITKKTDVRETEKEAKTMPKALAAHLEKLARTLPGNSGLTAPSTPEYEAFLHKAYPNTDIPLANIENERAAVQTIHGRPFARGKGQTGTWVTVGPSNAIYPEFVFRTAGSYVPNQYAAASRTTALAIASSCVPGHCRLWAAPAGGGVWRTDDALNGEPHWTYLGLPFGSNAVGSIVVDPNDASSNTIWVGTGEANASADSGYGVGIYMSTDGGDTWNGPLGQSVFNGRAVGTIAIQPGSSSVVYAGVTRAVHGLDSTDGGGVTLIPGAAKWGLYKSTDGGQSWTFIHNGSANASLCNGSTNEAGNGDMCSPRGVRRVLIDPTDPNTVYAGSYARGIWRSNDAGATWTQIKASLNPADTVTRPEFSVNKTPDGKTRMYVNEGNDGTNAAQFYRADSVETGTPVFNQLSSSNPADNGYGSSGLCESQCWYDNYVISPPGYPDLVYAMGSYAYGETGNISNGRGVVLSTDGGVTFSDMTMDATDVVHPNGIHPDQHFLVVNPSNPFQFWESSDGGIMMSSGSLANTSGDCAARGLSGAVLTRCQQLLSRVPTQLQSMNKGLTTLQFQSLSVSPFDSNELQGGTQDNGTWENYKNQVKWTNTMIGDGGQSGFDIGNSHFRFHTFFDAQPDVNFRDGQTIDWNWIGDPLGGEPQQFYVPIISDPTVAKTMFVGTGHVWRTKTQGVGSQSIDQFRAICNEWTGTFTAICGDWQPLGNPASAGRLTSTAFGSTRSGGDVASVRRGASDTSTLWAATSVGRVFISKNADADPATSVTFTRIDIASSPNRYIADIAVDPANANHAWIAYTGFNATTPATPGHLFEVTYNPTTNAATWTNRDYDLGDVPLTSVAFDNATGDIYAATDFGVLLLASGSTSWTLAAPGMPDVEVPALTIVPGARKLYAASHGLGAWLLNLP